MIEQGKLSFERNPNKELIGAGRVLYLTKDPELIKRQLSGERLLGISSKDLMDSVSTDVIFPNKAALSYIGQEGHLANFALTGLSGIINPGDIKKGNFQTLVAGESFARGSSRIHAPLALKEAGINLVIAKTERIFRENCVNTGIFIVDPKNEQAERLLNGESLSFNEIISDLSPLYQEIMKSRGLLSYFKNLESGKIKKPEVSTPIRPMTMAEKILAKKAGLRAVKPGDEIIAVPDKYYGYELQSPLMIKALRGEKAKKPEKVFLYSDHTALLWDENSQNLRNAQANFAKPLGISVFGVDRINGAPAICHTDMVENHALPGELILGNDSHTCTVGALNNLSIGKGALDLAGAIAYDKMVVTVPETIRINLKGRLPKGVTMKDFMLQFGARKELKKERVGSGRVFEFGGEALEEIRFDEQLKLTNMSIELLGFSGIIEPNKQIMSYLLQKRGLSPREIANMMVWPDENAGYSYIFDINLSTVEQTVSEPGDTQNGRPLSEVKKEHIKVQKVYIGSCTHGTPEDLRQAAEVLKGRKVAKDVKLYIQASSRANLESSESSGYVRELLEAGAELLPIGCGACMNAGPGSTEEGEIGLFATNRNFPGRTGRGKTYLSSPSVAAASAVAGYILGPEDLEKISNF